MDKQLSVSKILSLKKNHWTEVTCRELTGSRLSPILGKANIGSCWVFGGHYKHKDETCRQIPSLGSLSIYILLTSSNKMPIIHFNLVESLILLDTLSKSKYTEN